MLQARNKFPNWAGSESAYSFRPMTANMSTWDKDIGNSMRKETREEEEKGRLRREKRERERAHTEDERDEEDGATHSWNGLQHHRDYYLHVPYQPTKEHRQ